MNHMLGASNQDLRRSTKARITGLGYRPRFTVVGLSRRGLPHLLQVHRGSTPTSSSTTARFPGSTHGKVWPAGSKIQRKPVSAHPIPDPESAQRCLNPFVAQV